MLVLHFESHLLSFLLFLFILYVSLYQIVICFFFNFQWVWKPNDTRLRWSSGEKVTERQKIVKQQRQAIKTNFDFSCVNKIYEMWIEIIMFSISGNQHEIHHINYIALVYGLEKAFSNSHLAENVHLCLWMWNKHNDFRACTNRPIIYFFVSFNHLAFRAEPYIQYIHTRLVCGFCLWNTLLKWGWARLSFLLLLCALASSNMLNTFQQT